MYLNYSDVPRTLKESLASFLLERIICIFVYVSVVTQILRFDGGREKKERTNREQRSEGYQLQLVSQPSHVSSYN